MNHIDNVCSKANRSLAFLRRNCKISQTQIKTNTYTTLARPQLEYAALVLDPWTKKKCHRLEMVQRRAARYLFNSCDLSTSPTEMIQRLGWHSLQQRRAYIRLIFFNKSMNGRVAVEFISEHKPQVRDICNNHPLSFISIIDTRRYVQNSYLPRIKDQWNILPASVAMSASLDTFKEGLTHHKDSISFFSPCTTNTHALLFIFLPFAVFLCLYCTFTSTAHTCTSELISPEEGDSSYLEEEDIIGTLYVDC